MRSHPDVDLTEASFEPFLEFLEELAILRSVRHINENTDQFIAIDLILIFPETTDNLRLGRNDPKLPAQLKERISYQFIGNSFLVVKPPRQENFVPPG
jgi:hypothetical protein